MTTDSPFPSGSFPDDPHELSEGDFDGLVAAAQVVAAALDTVTLNPATRRAVLAEAFRLEGVTPKQGEHQILLAGYRHLGAGTADTIIEAGDVAAARLEVARADRALRTRPSNRTLALESVVIFRLVRWLRGRGA